MKKFQAFEQYVAKLIQKLGYSRVKSNIIYHRELDGEDTRFEIDIVYGLISRKYVECKYLEGSNVKLREVAKFKVVLDMLGIPNRKGIVVTNQYFTPRAAYFARRNKIKLVDKEKLEKLQKNVKSWFQKEKSLDERILELM